MLPPNLYGSRMIDYNRIDRLFLESYFDWEILSHPDGSLAYLSPSCEQIYGHNLKTLYQHPELLMSSIHSGDQEYLKLHTYSDSNRHIPATAELKMVSPAGETLNFEHTCIPIYDTEGQYLGRWARNRILAEKDLVSQKDMITPEIWQTVIGQAPDIITIIDTRGKILFTNSVPLSGDIRAPLGKCVYDYIIPEQRMIAFETIQRVIATGKSDSYEIASDRGGKRYWYMTRVGLVKQNGQIECVTLVIRDITDRKEIEQQLHKLNEELEQRVQERTLALQESLERHKVISELIPDYVYSAYQQENGKIILDWFSGALEQITGYSFDDINSRPFGWLSMVHPDDQQKVCQQIGSASLEHNTTLNYRFIHKNGSIRWLHDTIKRIASPDKHKEIYYWGAAEHITDQVLAETAIQRHTRQLESSERLSYRLRQVSNRQQALEVLVNESLNASTANLSGIYLLSNNHLQRVIVHGDVAAPPDWLSPSDNHLIHRLMNSREQVIFLPLIAANEYQACQFCVYLRRSNMQAVAMAPLRTSDKIIGFLFLAYNKLPAFSPDDRQFLGAVAEGGGNTLHRIQLMEELEQHIASRESELNVLREVMAITSSTLDLNVMLKQSLDTILDTTGAACGMVHLINPENRLPELALTCNASPTLLKQMTVLLEKNAYLAAVEQGQILNLQTTFPAKTTRKNSKPLAYLGVPMNTRGKTVGILSLFNFQTQAFSEYTETMLQPVTDQLATAVESIRLSQQARETLVIEERQRLARNLHDSVTQFLYSLVLDADIGAKFLERQEPENLKNTLHGIGETALQALREMRLMLFELKPHALAEEGLIKALNLRLEAVERRAGIDASLHVSGEEYLPPHMESEIYRLATEALNNALKHAAANTVQIELLVTAKHLRLEIKDDGKGFAANSIDRGGIGLSSMQARAQHIGGKLSIQSAADQGTTILLEANIQNKKGTK